MASKTFNIALVDTTDLILQEDFLAVAKAIQVQVSRDFAPVWDVDAVIEGFPSLSEVSPGFWPVTVDKVMDIQGVNGYHWVDDKGIPFSKVLYRDGWSLTASHEILEMLVNPYVNKMKVFKALDGSGQDVEYLVEVSDPVEDKDYGYRINGVLVSNFYYPAFFDLTTTEGKKYDHLGWLREPRKLLNGGYISWRNAAGEWFQAFMLENKLIFKKLGEATPLTTAETKKVLSIVGFSLLILSSIVFLVRLFRK